MLRVYLLFVVVFFQTSPSTCSEQKADEVCSTNPQCANLPTGDGKSQVCAFNYVSCNELTACAPDFSCARPDTVCVKHRCHFYSVCYPKSMISQTLCPPIARKLLLNNSRNIVFAIKDKINRGIDGLSTRYQLIVC